MSWNLPKSTPAIDKDSPLMQEHTMESHLTTEYDRTSDVVNGISEEERHGFGNGLHLRRHKCEALTNDAMHQTRKDWRDLIGPIETFGNANPYDGNFVALVLPFTRPERLAVSTYFLECKPK